MNKELIEKYLNEIRGMNLGNVAEKALDMQEFDDLKALETKLNLHLDVNEYYDSKIADMSEGFIKDIYRIKNQRHIRRILQNNQLNSKEVREQLRNCRRKVQDFQKKEKQENKQKSRNSWGINNQNRIAELTKASIKYSQDNNLKPEELERAGYYDKGQAPIDPFMEQIRAELAVRNEILMEQNDGKNKGIIQNRRLRAKLGRKLRALPHGTVDLKLLEVRARNANIFKEQNPNPQAFKKELKEAKKANHGLTQEQLEKWKEKQKAPKVDPLKGFNEEITPEPTKTIKQTPTQSVHTLDKSPKIKKGEKPTHSIKEKEAVNTERMEEINQKVMDQLDPILKRKRKEQEQELEVEL